MNLDEEHWIAVKNIFKYLRRTKNFFLIFGGGSKLKVEGCPNSDFMSDVEDRRSTSRCIFLCNGGSISWNSFKQSVIINLTIKAGYITTFEAAIEAF